MSPTTQIPTDYDRIDFINETVAQHFRLTVPQMMAQVRTERIAWPRQIAMAISRECTACSLQTIGSIFHKDHGTIIHAARTVKNRCDVQPATKALVEKIESLVMEKYPV